MVQALNTKPQANGKHVQEPQAWTPENVRKVDQDHPEGVARVQRGSRASRVLGFRVR